MGMKTEVYNFLAKSARLCSDCDQAAFLLENIYELQSRLEQPLRVAVVGIMKAGKSTFLNALMGESILDTGTYETTYTVSWFKYGKTPSLIIKMRDGTEYKEPFENLSKWTVRAACQENPLIKNVQYVIIYYPSEILKKMEFIDTPGLDSIYGTDSQNTLDFLSISSSKDTLAEASKADAVIYAFSRSANSFDANILDKFHSGGNTNTSPINSIGILTKADMSGIWDIFGDKTPVESALVVAQKQMEMPEMKKKLFSIYPVCAKAAEGCFKLNESDWKSLITSSQKTDIEELQDLLFDASTFCQSDDEEYEQFGTVAFRSNIMEKLGQYGILESVRQIKSGKSVQEILTIMRNQCGIAIVSDVLQNHFGNRVFLIKSQFIFNYLKLLVSKTKKNESKDSTLFHICEQILANIEELTSSLHTFKELKALQMYYNNLIRFGSQEEKEDFLRITGEYGKTVEEKLGMPFGSTVAELAESAQKKADQWHIYASHVMKPRSYTDTAKIIVRSYENILYHLSELNDE